jgi:hypothetical protein
MQLLSCTTQPLTQLLKAAPKCCCIYSGACLANGSLLADCNDRKCHVMFNGWLLLVLPRLLLVLPPSCRQKLCRRQHPRMPLPTRPTASKTPSSTGIVCVSIAFMPSHPPILSDITLKCLSCLAGAVMIQVWVTDDT